MKLDYKRMLRDVDVKQAQVQSDQANSDRFAGLVKGGGVTRAEYDNARFQLAANQQSVEALKTDAAVQLAKLGGDPEVDVHTMSDYLQAKAQVDEAQRQLDHTRDLRAVRRHRDAGGYGAARHVSRCLHRGVRHWSRPSDVWIEANPKETELTYVKPGDPVEVTVDTYPGRRWKGDGGEHRAQQRLGVLRAAGAEHLRQLGEGGAAHSGAHPGRAQAAAIRSCAPA